MDVKADPSLHWVHIFHLISAQKHLNTIASLLVLMRKNESHEMDYVKPLTFHSSRDSTRLCDHVFYYFYIKTLYI